MYEKSFKEITPCSKGDDIKYWVVFVAWSDFKAFRSHEIKLHMGYLVQRIDTILIIPVIKLLAQNVRND